MASGSIKVDTLVTVIKPGQATNRVFGTQAGYRGIMAILDSGSSLCGLYLVYTNGSNVPGYVTVQSASGVTITTETGKIKVTTGSSYGPMFLFINGTDDRIITLESAT